jgi:hypothetical protein
MIFHGLYHKFMLKLRMVKTIALRPHIPNTASFPSEPPALGSHRLDPFNPA